MWSGLVSRAPGTWAHYKPAHRLKNKNKKRKKGRTRCHFIASGFGIDCAREIVMRECLFQGGFARCMWINVESIYRFLWYRHDHDNVVLGYSYLKYSPYSARQTVQDTGPRLCKMSIVGIESRNKLETRPCPHRPSSPHSFTCQVPSIMQSPAPFECLLCRQTVELVAQPKCKHSEYSVQYATVFVTPRAQTTLL